VKTQRGVLSGQDAPAVNNNGQVRVQGGAPANISAYPDGKSPIFINTPYAQLLIEN